MAKPRREDVLKKEEIRYRFGLIESFLNDMENELVIDKAERSPDLEKISVLYGKVATNFTVLAGMLNIFGEKK